MNESTLRQIWQSKASISSSGYPYINMESFQLFMDHVPHLFGEGAALLNLVDHWQKTTDHQELVQKVIETMVLTAAVTAPSDLWLLKHILTSYYELELLPDLVSQPFQLVDFCKNHQLDQRIMTIDFSFFVSRGLFVAGVDGSLSVREHPATQDALNQFVPYSSDLPVDIVAVLAQYMIKANAALDAEMQSAFLLPPRFSSRAINWFPSHFEIEVGSRVLPIVLALRSNGLFQNLMEGQVFRLNNQTCAELLAPVLFAAGMLDQDHRVTRIGERVFQRGPGPYGIIHAYHTYLSIHSSKLKKITATKAWVSRGANVAASQDANAKTFALALGALSKFCLNYHFNYRVFIEHAVGQGEATRQRVAQGQFDNIEFFGADLEDAAIDRAIENQKRGDLPESMRFIRKADIGQPSVIIDAIREAGLPTENAVMIVGNGFHEVRSQTDDRMIQVFKEYCDAGIFILFTEESGLFDEDLLATGFNTYHAGFRYVHEFSGQGLRPVYDDEATYQPLSWTTCATRGGYTILEEYSPKTRTIYPYPKPNGKNPAISVTYFCVPTNRWQEIKGQKATGSQA